MRLTMNKELGATDQSLMISLTQKASHMRASRRHLILAAVAVAFAVLPGPMTGAARADDKVSLFTVITLKDEIVVGFSNDDLGKLGGNDAPAIARALKEKGTLGAWQYAVRKNAAGELEQAPLRQIGLLANDSLRIEPYATPLKIIPMK